MPSKGPTVADEYCEACDYDAHLCGGCGEPLAHGIGACRDCTKRTMEPYKPLICKHCGFVVPFSADATTRDEQMLAAEVAFAHSLGHDDKDDRGN